MDDYKGFGLEIEGTDSIRPDLLETFPCEALDGADQLVEHVTEEFSSLCPFSGLPDFAMVSVQFIPDRLAVDLKSLKYYYLSYRSVGIFQEHMIQFVFKHLWELLEPKWLRVEVTYNIRGGIESTNFIDSDESYDED